MAENVNVVDVVLDKKMDDYSYDSKRNLQAPSELMVTITLFEYRDLISKVATRDADISKAEADRYSRNSENEKLKKEVQELKEQIYDLQRKYCKPCVDAGVESVEEDN